MAKKKLRVALIGCGGNMREAHIPPMLEDGAVDLVAVNDTSEEQARLLMDKWGAPVPFYTDYKKMINASQLDALLISSPHAMHYEQVRYALDQDLHVLSEKPLTISPKHTAALLRLTEKRSRILIVSYQRNFYAPHLYMRELIRNGEIGDIRGVVSYITENWKATGWRLDPKLSGGGMFFDAGSHLVASTLWMTGLQPVEVSAFLDNDGRPVDVTMVVNIRFKGGALGTLNTFGNTHRFEGSIAVHGSKGCIEFRLNTRGVKSLLLNDEPVTVPARIREERPDDVFYRLVRNGGKGYELPQYTLAVAQVSEAAYQSVERGIPVTVNQ